MQCLWYDTSICIIPAEPEKKGVNGKRLSPGEIVAGGVVVEEVSFPFTPCQSIMSQFTTVGADRQH